MSRTSDQTFSEDEYQEALAQARDGLLVSDWTPWADLNEALEDIAYTVPPVPQEKIDAARSIYQSHI